MYMAACSSSSASTSCAGLGLDPPDEGRLVAKKDEEDDDDNEYQAYRRLGHPAAASRKGGRLCRNVVLADVQRYKRVAHVMSRMLLEVKAEGVVEDYRLVTLM